MSPSPTAPVPTTAPEPPPAAYLSDLVERALSEDLGGDPGLDVTTIATVAADALATVEVRSRATGVLAGGVAWPMVVTAASRRAGQPAPEVTTLVPDGRPVAPGDVVTRLRGPVRALLVAERTGLNLAGRASGIATTTRRWVDALSGSGVRVLDTRKTPPGLRLWDKYAVRCGGGVNKRFGLFDVAMIKDNHVAAAGGVAAAIAAVRAASPGVALQVEVDGMEQAMQAVGAGARYLMCDNMSPELLRQVVTAVREAVVATDGPGVVVELEATGGLRLDRAAEFAATGIDYMSVGALTHSAPVLDLGLDWIV